MKTARVLVALTLLFAAAQSCTNDFDKFEVDEASSGGSGAVNAGATTSRGGSTVNTGGTTSRGGTTSSAGGDTGAAGADAAGAGGSSGGAGGAGGEPCLEAIETDILHCGECGRACSASDAAALECAAGLCTSSCAPGFANCAQPATGADDGCETDVSADAAQCGGCGNACPGGFVCSDARCACDNNGDCGNGSGVDCVAGQCECDSVLCRPGEECRADGGDRFCSCNGSADPGCSANEFCCEAGCTDVESSAQNCGACGRGCTSGFACVSGACECDSAEDCGASPSGAAGAGGTTSEGGAAGSSGGVTSGGAGATSGGAGGEPATTGGASGGGGAPDVPLGDIACVAGRCVCTGSTCSEGQRCLPNGSCG